MMVDENCESSDYEIFGPLIKIQKLTVEMNET